MPVWATITQWRPTTHVVPDLHQIINFGPLADDRILKRPTVDGGVGPDLNVILYDHAANLRHFEVPPAAHGEAEPVLADARACVQDHPVADERVRNGRQRAHVAVAPNRDPVAYHGAGGEHACPARCAPPAR